MRPAIRRGRPYGKGNTITQLPPMWSDHRERTNASSLRLVRRFQRARPPLVGCGAKPPRTGLRDSTKGAFYAPDAAETRVTLNSRC